MTAVTGANLRAGDAYWELSGPRRCPAASPQRARTRSERRFEGSQESGGEPATRAHSFERSR
jgi:hypothetical protein